MCSDAHSITLRWKVSWEDTLSFRDHWQRPETALLRPGRGSWSGHSSDHKEGCREHPQQVRHRVLQPTRYTSQCGHWNLRG